MKRFCSCGRALHAQTKGSSCLACIRIAAAVRRARPCIDCGGHKNVNAAARCRSCSDKNPATRRRRNLAVSASRRAKLRTDPEFAKRAREHGRQLGLSGAARAASRRPDVVARRAIARSRAVMGWCPAEYRPLYDELTKSRRLRAADARRAVEQQIAIDQARMDPFERQLAQVRAGRAIVAKPDLRDRREFAFSLASGSSLAEAGL